MFTLVMLIINVIILIITKAAPESENMLILMYIDLGCIVTNMLHLYKEDK